MVNNEVIYLDHAAATPVDSKVLAAMQPFFSDDFYNPSATYASAVRVRKDLELARARVAHWLGARPSEIIFTAGATEANNLAIHGVMRRALRLAYTDYDLLELDIMSKVKTPVVEKKEMLFWVFG